MKQWGWTVLFLIVAAALNGQALDQPVATIKLDKKSSLVSQKAFRDKVTALESSQGSKMDLETKKSLLQEMLTAELIRMDMEAQGIKGTDEDLLKQFRSSNPGLTDAQIKQEVEKQSGQSWEDATAALKRQVANMKYFNQFPQAQEVGKVTVTDKDIRDFYDANTALFTAPDFVRVSHIFFDTTVKPKGTLAEIQKRADDTLKKITSGQATFEEMAASVSEDSSSSKTNGDIGFLPRTLESQVGQQLLNVFGRDFLNGLFALKKGVVSPVMTSNAGLHIVRVTQSIEKHFMSLDEPVYPGKDDTTVKLAIQQTLQQRKLMAAQAKMVNEIGDDLKKKAVIKTFEQNF